MSKDLFGKGGPFDNAFRSLDPEIDHPIYGKVKFSWFKSRMPEKVEAYNVAFLGHPVPASKLEEYNKKMAAQSNPNNVPLTEDEELAKALEMSLTTKEQGENANQIYITGNGNSNPKAELNPEEIQKVEHIDAVIPNSVPIFEELKKALKMLLTTTGNNNSNSKVELTPEEIRKKVEHIEAVIKANEALGVASQIASQEESLGGSFSTQKPVEVDTPAVSTPITVNGLVVCDENMFKQLIKFGLSKEDIEHGVAEVVGLINEISE